MWEGGVDMQINSANRLLVEHVPTRSHRQVPTFAQNSVKQAQRLLASSKALRLLPVTWLWVVAKAVIP